MPAPRAANPGQLVTNIRPLPAIRRPDPRIAAVVVGVVEVVASTRSDECEAVAAEAAVVSERARMPEGKAIAMEKCGAGHADAPKAAVGERGAREASMTNPTRASKSCMHAAKAAAHTAEAVATEAAAHTAEAVATTKAALDTLLKQKI